MSLPAWADTKEKKVMFGIAKALGADADTLCDFDVCSAFVELKGKLVTYSSDGGTGGTGGTGGDVVYETDVIKAIRGKPNVLLKGTDGHGGLRWYLKTNAEHYGLTGFVCLLRDKQITITIEGLLRDIGRYYTFLHECKNMKLIVQYEATPLGQRPYRKYLAFYIDYNKSIHVTTGSNSGEQLLRLEEDSQSSTPAIVSRVVKKKKWFQFW